jgi:hypothetical protein
MGIMEPDNAKKSLVPVYKQRFVETFWQSTSEITKRYVPLHKDVTLTDAWAELSKRKQNLIKRSFSQIGLAKSSQKKRHST